MFLKCSDNIARSVSRDTLTLIEDELCRARILLEELCCGNLPLKPTLTVLFEKARGFTASSGSPHSSPAASPQQHRHPLSRTSSGSAERHQYPLSRTPSGSPHEQQHRPLSRTASGSAQSKHPSPRIPSRSNSGGQPNVVVVNSQTGAISSGVLASPGPRSFPAALPQQASNLPTQNQHFSPRGQTLRSRFVLPFPVPEPELTSKQE